MDNWTMGWLEHECMLWIWQSINDTFLEVSQELWQCRKSLNISHMNIMKRTVPSNSCEACPSTTASSALCITTTTDIWFCRGLFRRWRWLWSMRNLAMEVTAICCRIKGQSLWQLLNRTWRTCLGEQLSDAKDRPPILADMTKCFLWPQEYFMLKNILNKYTEEQGESLGRNESLHRFQAVPSMFLQHFSSCILDHPGVPWGRSLTSICTHFSLRRGSSVINAIYAAIRWRSEKPCSDGPTMSNATPKWDYNRWPWSSDDLFPFLFPFVFTHFLPAGPALRGLPLSHLRFWFVSQMLPAET